MKKLSSLIIVFLVITSVNSQTFSNGSPSRADLNISTKIPIPDEFVGSIYYNEEFVPAKMKDGGNSMDVFVRYNSLENAIEVKLAKNSNSINIMPRNKNILYDVDEYEIFLEEFTDSKGKKVNGYFYDFYSKDSIRFLGKPVIEVIPGVSAISLYTDSKPRKIEVQMRYFLQESSGELHEFNLNKKQIRNLLGQRYEVNEYLKANRIADRDDFLNLLQNVLRNNSC